MIRKMLCWCFPKTIAQLQEEYAHEQYVRFGIGFRYDTISPEFSSMKGRQLPPRLPYMLPTAYIKEDITTW